MIEMINALTGTRMCVAPERKAEYLAAGHRLAAKPEPEPADNSGKAAPDAGKNSPAATKRKTTAKK